MEANAENPGLTGAAEDAPVYRVVSPCIFGYSGLEMLLRDAALRRENGDEPGRTLVMVPDMPLLALQTLRTLAALLRAGPIPVEVWVLTGAEPGWLWQTLVSLTGGRLFVSAVRVLSSRVSVAQLYSQLAAATEPPPLLSDLAGDAGRAPQQGLTLREVEVLECTLNGQRIREIAGCSGLSVKTLYNQQMSGLRKLVLAFPSAGRLIPGRQRRGLRRYSAGGVLHGILPEEKEFAVAVENGLVFPVFQPVVGNKKNILGFEILSRWFRGGKVLGAGDFLPELQSLQVWVLLTASVMKTAVEHINRYEGKYWFSVNIPVCLTESPALLRMLDTARGYLRSPEWARCLVLEFSENTSLSPESKALDILRALETRGCRVLLDDCLSEDFAMFPVRHARFSGYKLDISVVGRMMNDAEERYLVQGLAHYCRLSGRECIAEGVESRETFMALTAAGVEAFQGFLFSRPVLDEELDALITRSGPEFRPFTAGGMD